MSKTIDEQILEFLDYFAQNFAEKDEEGNWWGHDTNLGNLGHQFKQALKQFKSIRRRSIPAPKHFKFYYQVGDIRRKTLARSIWGNSAPAWWNGSTAEFEALEVIKSIKGTKP